MVRQWFAIIFGIIQFTVKYYIYTYVYTCFINFPHIVFHSSFLMYVCSQKFGFGGFSICQMLEDLDIIEAAHGRHNNTNELGTEFVACLAILSALFWMVEWPFRRLSDLQLGDKKVRLNHLVYDTWWSMLIAMLLCSFSHCQTLFRDNL